ncbi:unnamed protein product [Rotaria sp. Silwood2]|nr:unnamed protein product [Rotaria sp. Silwood2]
MNTYIFTPTDLEKCSCLNFDRRLSTTASAFDDLENVVSKQHQIICFDINIHNGTETKVTVDHPQYIPDATQFFNTATECLEYQDQKKYINTFVIVSEQEAEHFIPKIYTRENILLIYILRRNHESVSFNPTLEWFANYEKVKQFIYTTFEDLLEDVRKDVKYYLVFEARCGLHFEKFGESAGCSYRSWHQEFIDILCNLSYPENQFKVLLPLLKQCKATPYKIEIFEQDYKTKGPIYYCTKEPFIYASLNQALRQRNIPLLFKFGFLIKDLNQQIEKAQKQSIKNYSNRPILTLYRGQQMSRDDIEKLSDDLYIYNTTMFSSSFDHNVSKIFQDERLKRDSFLQNVLFEIEIDIRKRTPPFADISEQSQFEDEVEFLFMIGNPFKVQNIKYIEQENYYLIKLVLLNDVEPKDVRSSIDYSGRRKIKNCLSTLTLQMYYITSIELNIIYQELLNLYPSEKWIEAVKLYRFGQYLQYRKRLYQTALDEYNRALMIWRSFNDDKDLNCSIDIGHTYTLIGICYQSLGIDEQVIKKNLDRAHKYYKIAHKNSRCEHERTETLDCLANICAHKMLFPWKDEKLVKKYGPKTIKYKWQYIEKILHSDLYDKIKVAESLEFLAYYCKKLMIYDIALNSYKMALNIYQQQFEVDVHSINNCINEIVEIYIKQTNDTHSAIHYQKLRHEIRLKYNEHRLDDNKHTAYHKKQRIIDSYIELAKLYAKDNQYDLAFEQLKLVNALYSNERLSKVVSIYDLINVRNTTVMKTKYKSRRKTI